jgi:hypothetical protein
MAVSFAADPSGVWSQLDRLVQSVMRGLDPRLIFFAKDLYEDGWIAGSSPAMTPMRFRGNATVGSTNQSGLTP